MTSDPKDDPLHPSRWKSNWHSDPDGPISGEDYAYLKDLIANRMGVGNYEPDRFADHSQHWLEPRPRNPFVRLWKALRSKRR